MKIIKITANNHNPRVIIIKRRFQEEVMPIDIHYFVEQYFHDAYFNLNTI